MTHGKGAASGLTPMQKAYAEARVRGLNQADAAREAGSSHPLEAGCRWEKNKRVAAYLMSLREAAHALATAQQVDQQALTAAPSSVNGLTAVADLAEALGHASRLMRSNLAAEAIRENGTVDIEALRNAPPGVLKRYKAKSRIERVPGGEKGETREIEEVAFETESTLSAAQTLIRHYDAMDAPPPQVGPGRVQIVAVLGDLAARQALQILASKLRDGGQMSADDVESALQYQPKAPIAVRVAR